MRHHLKAARQTLAALGVSWKKFLPAMLTEPVDFKDQPWFLNQVIRVRTNLKPTELLAACMRTEQEQGRRRELPRVPERWISTSCYMMT